VDALDDQSGVDFVGSLRSPHSTARFHHTLVGRGMQKSNLRDRLRSRASAVFLSQAVEAGGGAEQQASVQGDSMGNAMIAGHGSATVGWRLLLQRNPWMRKCRQLFVALTGRLYAPCGLWHCTDATGRPHLWHSTKAVTGLAGKTYD
jgi:hypothetical protein